MRFYHIQPSELFLISPMDRQVLVDKIPKFAAQESLRFLLDLGAAFSTDEARKEYMRNLLELGESIKVRTLGGG